MTRNWESEERLEVWDLLLREETPARSVLEHLAGAARGQSSDEERLSTAMLVAVAALLGNARRAARRNLMALLRYRFSQLGAKSRPHGLDPRELANPDMLGLMGLHLTWPEAMLSVGGNPADYTALSRTEKAVRAEFLTQWGRIYGTTPPDSLTHGR